jgi:hypothetical protein
VRRAILVLAIVAGTIAIGFRVLGSSSQPSGILDLRVAPASEASLQRESTSTVASFQVLATRSLNCMRLTTVPTMDGSFSDWPAAEGIALNRDTAYSFQGGIANFADLSAIIRSGWDEQTLYFAIEVHDDVLVTDSTDVWRDDGLEIGLDGLYDRDAWGDDDHQYTIVADGRVTDRGTPAPEIAAGIQVTDQGYNVEIAVPMSQLLTGIPISGTVMGFTAGLHDDDDGDSWDAYLIWEGTNTSSKPEEWGSLVFGQRLEDRIAALENKIAELERRSRELLDILSEFEQVTPP